MKAYVVREGQDGECAIVFATNGAAARRLGANELNLEFDEVESCKREPEFDQFAPGPVPLYATLGNGWWHTCSGCQCTFDNEGRREEDDDREDEFDPGTDAKGNPYCSPTCMMTEWAERRDRTARQVAAIEVTSTKWPEATNIITYNGGRLHDQVRTVFRLPGVPDPIDWAPGDPVALVAQRSADDFRRLYGKPEAP